jgi:flavin reductase (DIM6/NTAB) family NADH-FMN oxidoreductase RutF
MIVFDPAEHDPGRCQGVLSQLVVPRPIAMISTADEGGVVNVAPFSYYMPVTGKPMLIAVTMGALRDCDGQPKHTYTNALRSGDFVVNVTSGRFAADIETAAMEFPRGESELAALGWTALASARVSSPSIAESPAHLECLVRRVIDVGDLDVHGSGVHIVLAEVICITLDESVATADYRVDQRALSPIGRMGLPYFTRVDETSLYELERIPYAESRMAGGAT